MPMQRVEVITSVERRRRWSLAEKERLVAASLEPGVSVSEVARAAGLHVSQLFRWRKQPCTRIEAPAPEPRDEPKLVPVTIVPTPTVAEPSPPPRRGRRRSGMIEIEVSGGRRVRVGGDVDAEALRRVLDVLEGR